MARLPEAIQACKKDTVDEVDLIIWDCFAELRVPLDQKLTVGILNEGQQELIQIVGKETAQKFPNSKLGTVWLGGPRLDCARHGFHPMDITLEFMGKAVINMDEEVPFSHEELRAKGFRRVKLDADQAEDARIPPAASAAGSSAVIFHSPRALAGQKLSFDCNSLFYQEARAKSGAMCGDDGSFDYEFQPTMQWYAGQAREGRGYAHMLVAPWQETLEAMGARGKADKSGMS
ncbi:unnamed protein product [Parascedosporium putredinis]|uniref:Uncharacterized protein n=1 Tax=Parascedosporium putredinis TaxID=1442378 RepID=A0A9P1GW31_9PEZI|nr:unnamed protein product [Parascedosporium putredinis]CAI7989070.1 unnamed protein product [Parascedosporium putredinis]